MPFTGSQANFSSINALIGHDFLIGRFPCCVFGGLFLQSRVRRLLWVPWESCLCTGIGCNSLSLAQQPFQIQDTFLSTVAWFSFLRCSGKCRRGAAHIPERFLRVEHWLVHSPISGPTSEMGACLTSSLVESWQDCHLSGHSAQ